MSERKGLGLGGEPSAEPPDHRKHLDPAQIDDRFRSAEGNLLVAADKVHFLETLTEQLSTQLRAAEAALADHRQAIMTIGQRLDLVARNQVVTTYRTQALEAAVKSKGPGEQPDTVVRYARAYYDFLMEDARKAEEAMKAAAMAAAPTPSVEVPIRDTAATDDETLERDAAEAAEFFRMH